MKRFVVKSEMSPFVIESESACGEDLMELARKELIRNILGGNFELSLKPCNKGDESRQMEFDFVTSREEWKSEKKWEEVTPVDCWINE